MLFFLLIASVILVDYYILRTSRQLFDAARAEQKLPTEASTPQIGWLAVFSCIVGTLAGLGIKFSIPSLNSILVAGLLYGGLAKINPSLCRLRI